MHSVKTHFVLGRVTWVNGKVNSHKAHVGNQMGYSTPQSYPSGGGVIIHSTQSPTHRMCEGVSTQYMLLLICVIKTSSNYKNVAGVYGPSPPLTIVAHKYCVWQAMHGTAMTIEEAMVDLDWVSCPVSPPPPPPPPPPARSPAAPPPPAPLLRRRGG